MYFGGGERGDITETPLSGSSYEAELLVMVVLGIAPISNEASVAVQGEQLNIWTHHLS